MVLDSHPPVKKFLLTLQATSPIVPANGLVTLTIQGNCGKCRQPFKVPLQQSQGGALCLDVHGLREMFERIGTAKSMEAKDVTVGQRIKDIGDLVVEWCNAAEVGEFRDVPGIAGQIMRLQDDTVPGQRIDLKAHSRLVLAGGEC